MGYFENVRYYRYCDVVAQSAFLNRDIILEAYSKGIFPWPDDEESLIPWCSPDPRAVLDFENFHIPKSVKREIKKSDFEFRFNTVFDEVIRNCASAGRKGQNGTWIIQSMIDEYIALNREGYAVSFETWQDNWLVGGCYGIFINNVFSGESMFHKVSAASKFSLINLVSFMRDNYGLQWIDVQQLTPLLALFGAHEISRDDYLKRISVIR